MYNYFNDYVTVNNTNVEWRWRKYGCWSSETGSDWCNQELGWNQWSTELDWPTFHFFFIY